MYFNLDIEYKYISKILKLEMFSLVIKHDLG